MCPVQTTYAAEMDAAFPGQRATLELTNVSSKAAEGSDINFGLAVVRGTSDDQCKLPSAASQGFLGVSEYTTAWAANGSDVHLYPEDREVNILDFGKVYAICEDGCVPGDDVFFRHTAPGVEVIGSFRTDSDGGNADEVVGGKFESTASAGELAIIKLSGEAPAASPLDLVETITAAGASAVALTTQVTLLDTTLGAQAITLADGVEGQEKTLKMTVDGATDSVLTPANLHDGATLTFADVNDSCVLRFVGGTWLIISNNGVALA